MINYVYVCMLLIAAIDLCDYLLRISGNEKNYKKPYGINMVTLA